MQFSLFQPTVQERSSTTWRLFSRSETRRLSSASRKPMWTGIWDTEKIIQVVTAMVPASVKMPRPLKGKSGNDGIRVYAYAGKAVCLKDFAEIQSKPSEFADAKSFFEDIAYDAWMEFKKLRSYQGFSGLMRSPRSRTKLPRTGCRRASFFR